MADLKAMAAELGFDNPRTLISTGNLVFETRKAGIAKLETGLKRPSKRLRKAHHHFAIPEHLRHPGTIRVIPEA